MNVIKNYDNPYYLSDQTITKKAADRNLLCQRVASVALIIGLCTTFGVGVVAAKTLSRLPCVLTGISALTSLIIYKTYVFIRDIDESLESESFGWTRLHKAAATGQVMMTKLLLFLGANPIKSANGDTPLHMACFEVKNPNSERHLSVMQILLNAGANINAVGNWGRCPLHYALEARHVDRVQFLVDHGAFINLKRSCSPDWSPWQYAEYKVGKNSLESKISSDPRDDSELLKADKRIHEILSQDGAVYTP